MRSSAEYCPTFATTIFAGGGGADGFGMSGSSFFFLSLFLGCSFVDYLWRFLWRLLWHFGNGVRFGRLCNSSFGGFFLGLPRFFFWAVAPEVDGVTAGGVSLDLAGPST